MVLLGYVLTITKRQKKYSKIVDNRSNKIDLKEKLQFWKLKNRNLKVLQKMLKC